MIRRELVDHERWVTPHHFHRVFAVYQVLPGPEAHELCVYFGMRAGGRLGGLLAGLGFMLPGLLLMLLLSWAYYRFGAHAVVFAALFYGTQPAITAVVARAVHRIGGPVLTDRWLWAAALTAAGAELAGLPFILSLFCAGLAYLLAHHRRLALAGATLALPLALALLTLLQAPLEPGAVTATPAAAADAPGAATLFASGLRAGLLSFGGAYTAIPFLRRDAVTRGGWMTDDQFLDGLALSGILPAPMVIFGTFVGFLGGGLVGALAVTAGIFIPAFGFTLVAHDTIERLILRPGLHTFLTGVTAGVVGLIAVVALVLARASLDDGWRVGIALLSVVALYRWHGRLVVPAVVLGGGLAGWLIQLLSAPP